MATNKRSPRSQKDKEGNQKPSFTNSDGNHLPPRRSKRIYPERLCGNPQCIISPKFKPDDLRRKFCCKQCRVNYYNDQRRELDNNTFINAKRLKEIDNKLLKIYARYANEKGYCAVRKELFHYENIEVMLLVKELNNPTTGGKVKGFFRFGIELHPQDQNYYIIHKIK